MIGILFALTLGVEAQPFQTEGMPFPAAEQIG